MHIHFKFCKFKNPNCFSIRQVQNDVSVCQGVFPLQFHEYCGYALKKKSIYTDYWELFSKACWTSITSDAFNHMLFQLPGSRKLLTSPQRENLAFVSCTSYPLNFLFFLIHLSPLMVSQDLCSFPVPSFSPPCTRCVQSRGERLGAERGQDLFSVPIVA